MPEIRRAGEHEALEWRYADAADLCLLAFLNHQLIADEGHRNEMDCAQLEERMRGWLAGEYRAVLFMRAGEVLAYALFRPDGDGRLHLRQFFVARHARRQGVGRAALSLLRREIISGQRLSLEVLSEDVRSAPLRAYAINFRVGPNLIDTANVRSPAMSGCERSFARLFGC